jgi:effector-binding domain-containing protein
MSTDVKLTEPKVEERTEQHYMGIRTQVPMSALGEQIPTLIDEVFAWLGRHEIALAGPPLARFHVIDMEGKLDIELGVPVAGAVAGDDRVSPGVMPAGRYASLIYTGVENGIAGNAALLDWGAAQGLTWDRWDDPKGDAFGGRVEYFLDGPEDHPDPATWDTEVAIRLAD